MNSMEVSSRNFASMGWRLGFSRERLIPRINSPNKFTPALSLELDAEMNERGLWSACMP